MRSVFTEGDLKKVQAEVDAKKKLQQAQIAPAVEAAVEPVVSATPPPRTDDLLSSISKFIPGEAVAIFIGSFGILSSALPTTPVATIGVVMFVICLLVAIYISYSKAGSDKITLAEGTFSIPGKYIKTAITAVAFVIWAINIEGFITILKGYFTWYDPVIGGLAILVYTSLIPIFYQKYSNS